MIRQPNQGLLFARLAGFKAAKGEFTLLLDSDDLISLDKLSRQINAMRVESADVSYTDSGNVEFAEGPWESLRKIKPKPALETTDPTCFYVQVQPPPHSPLFRTGYLRELLEASLFAPHARYNPVAEIWFYPIRGQST
ncbi:MAG: glycosyltransferase family 2 protein [Candidatus Synoicihabitans palmerolidicus]|nr:glycosyltransferase family 2 protein [Candidatus Synoicihabitans palmerolidicus]